MKNEKENWPLVRKAICSILSELREGKDGVHVLQGL